MFIKTLPKSSAEEKEEKIVNFSWFSFLAAVFGEMFNVKS